MTVTAHPPPGWIEEAPTGDARMFHSPDGGGTFVVARYDDVAGPVERAADDYARKLARDGSVSSAIVDGQAVVHISAPDARVKAVAARSGDPPMISVLVAVCAARDPALLAECEPQLATVWLPVDSRYAPHSNVSLYWIGGGTTGGLTLVVLAVGWLRRARRKRDLDHSSALSDGELVTITGTVRAVADPLSAPLTGKRCVLYRAHARVYSRDPVPRLLAEPFELETVTFAVETPRGLVRVDERAPAVAVTADTVVDDGQDRIGEFLAKHRVADKLRASTQLDEIVVEAGQTVTLRGVIRFERDDASTAERGYRDDAPRAATLVATGSEPVTLLRLW